MAANKLRRESIADHLSHRELSCVERKPVVGLKALQKRSFAKSNGAMASRMKKASFGRVYKASGDSGCHLAPAHATVDVLKAIALAMALQLGAIGQG